MEKQLLVFAVMLTSYEWISFPFFLSAVIFLRHILETNCDCAKK